MNPRRHRVILLAVLASTQCLLLIVLSLLVLTTWGVEAAGPTSPNSLLNIRLSPNPTHPGSTVQVSGSLGIPGGYPILDTQCMLYSSDSNLFQGQPTCTLGADGSINGGFQVNISAIPQSYPISVSVLFAITSLPYNEYWNCSTQNVAHTTTSAGYYGEVTNIFSNLGYYCQVDDSGTLTIQPVPQVVTTTSNTKFVPVTITRISTTTTNIQQVCSQLPVIQIIATASVTAIVTAVATRVYAKRRPGFAFDVEVRHGIDRKRSSD